MTRNACERRLRIVHVTQGLDMGGLEKVLVEFARHADRDRFDLRFVSLTSRGCLADDVEACGWPVTTLDDRGGLRPGLAFRLARLFRQWQVDVVHTHDDRPLIYGTIAARLARVPLNLHTRHGQSPGNSHRRTRLINLAARLTDHFVCVSEDSTRLAVEQGVAARKVSALWNGIDVTRFTYTGPQPQGPAVTVARLSPEKDIETLVRAAAVIVRSEPEFRLEIAGDGVCMPALRQLTDELRLGEHVRFLGQVRDVPALLARARLFVLPSVTEGVSLTLLEAMARGLPVVCTQVGGNPEVVAEGETGLLVPMRNPEKLAAAMLRVWREGETGRRLGLAGRQRVEEHFDIRRMVAAYEALYVAKHSSRKARDHRLALVTSP